MYINPFVAGALLVLVGEFVGLIIYGFARIRRAEKEQRQEQDDETDE